MTTPGWLSALLFVIAPSAAMAAPASVEFSHGEWQLVCDNTRTCRAAGYTSEELSSSVSVLLIRKAGANADVTAQLQLADAGEGGSPEGDLRLWQGSRDLGKVPSADSHTRIHTLSATQAQAVVRAFVGQGPISVRDAAGTQWQLSDRGATAVLLKMDDVQGRVGTPSALVRKGNKANSTVLPPLPAPRITRGRLLNTSDSDRALAQSPALLQAVRSAFAGLVKSEDCWGSDGEELSSDAIAVERLDADHLLVSTRCWLAAYNAANVYWTTGSTPPYQLKLVSITANNYGNGELTGDHKGRGIGDCWSHEAWQWNGKQFVPSSVSNTGLCRGQPGGFWELPSLVTEMDSAGTRK